MKCSGLESLSSQIKHGMYCPLVEKTGPATKLLQIEHKKTKFKLLEVIFGIL